MSSLRLLFSFQKEQKKNKLKKIVRNKSNLTKNVLLDNKEIVEKIPKNDEQYK